MTHTEEHTPTPWMWDSDLVKDDPFGRIRYRVVANGETITQLYYSSYAGGPTNAEANAAFIVKACNHHEELVRALQFYAEGSHYKEGRGWDSQPTVEDGEVARAALAKVSA